MKLQPLKSLRIAALAASILFLSSCGKSIQPHDHQVDSTRAQTTDYYTCVMHPQVHSDKPGSCPICHMDLVKASSVAGSGAGAAAPSLALNERSMSLADVAVTAVRSETIGATLLATGAIEIPEPNRVIVSARFSGRIEKLHVASIGAQVRKKQPLFDVYSPDLVQAQQELLQILKGTGSASTVAADGRSDGAFDRSQLLSAMRSKLQVLGLASEQIRQLESSGTAPLVTTYYAPAAGTVIDKKIVEGMYISEGLPLYEIADLSTVWNIADVYESDASRIRIGDKAEISLQNQSDRMWPGTVSFIYPVVNAQSRTVKIRVTVNNTAGGLRPNTYTQTLFTQRPHKALAVPVSAVLRTGKRNLVYVRTDAEHHFQSREVILGAKDGDKYEIVSGLREGEVVVTQGGYLIDSESQLRSASSQ